MAQTARTGSFGPLLGSCACLGGSLTRVPGVTRGLDMESDISETIGFTMSIPTYVKHKAD